MSFTTQRYAVDLYRSRLLLSDFVDQFNTGKALGERLRQPHVHLAEMLQELQHREVMRAQHNEQFLAPNEDLPRFFTCNKYLAKRCKCSERKIRYLISRLKTAGLVADYVWHGRQKEFELRLHNDIIFLFWDTAYYRRFRSQRTNVVSIFTKRTAPALPKVPAVLWTEKLRNLMELYRSGSWYAIPAVEQRRLAAECGVAVGDLAALAALPQTQTLPPNSSSSSLKLDTSKLNISSGANPPTEDEEVEKKTASPTANSQLANVASNHLEPVAGNETNAEAQTPDSQTESEPETENSGRGAGEIPKEAPDTIDVAAAHLSKPNRMELKRLVNVLWKQTLRLIYDHQGTWLNDTQETQGKARLAEFFCYHSPTKWDAQYREMQRRIMLVRRWLDREERKGNQYRVAVPSVYFDIRRRKQFVATKAWYVRDRANRWELNRRKKLAKAMRDYQRALLPNNDIDPVAIYRKWYHELDRLGSDLITEFHQFISDHTHDQAKADAGTPAPEANQTTAVPPAQAG